MMRARDMIKFFAKLARELGRDEHDARVAAKVYGPGALGPGMSGSDALEKREYEGRADGIRLASDKLWAAIKEAQK